MDGEIPGFGSGVIVAFVTFLFLDCFLGASLLFGRNESLLGGDDFPPCQLDFFKSFREALQIGPLGYASYARDAL